MKPARSSLHFCLILFLTACGRSPAPPPLSAPPKEPGRPAVENYADTEEFIRETKSYEREKNFREKYIASHEFDSGLTEAELEPAFEKYWRRGTPHVILRTRCAFVFDGDTLKTEDGFTVRFLGVNAPEIAHPNRGETMAEPYGDAAAGRLRAWLSGKPITLIVPADVPIEKYGRLLALVVADRRIAQVELLRAGLAKHYFLSNRELINEAEWYALEDKARAKKAGVWGYN